MYIDTKIVGTYYKLMVLMWTKFLFRLRLLMDLPMKPKVQKVFGYKEVPQA